MVRLQKSVTIYMSDEQREQIDRLSARFGCSPSEIIRTAIKLYAIQVSNLGSGLPGRPRR